MDWLLMFVMVSGASVITSLIGVGLFILLDSYRIHRRREAQWKRMCKRWEKIANGEIKLHD